MAGIVLRKTGVVLLTILKWILQAALVALKLALGMAKLFLLLLGQIKFLYNELLLVLPKFSEPLFSTFFRLWIGSGRVEAYGC